MWKAMRRGVVPLGVWTVWHRLPGGKYNVSWAQWPLCPLWAPEIWPLCVPDTCRLAPTALGALPGPGLPYLLNSEGGGYGRLSLSAVSGGPTQHRSLTGFVTLVSSLLVTVTCLKK